MKCLNCNFDFEGSYCSSCGQSAKISPLKTKDVFRELPASLLNLERRFWNTLKDLIKNPYQLTKDYATGKRKYYAPPLQFFFFFATLDYLLDLLFFSEPFENVFEEISKTTASAGDTMENIRWAANQFIYLDEKYSNYISLVLPLSFGLVLWVFVRKKLNLAESITFSYFILSLAYYFPYYILIPLSFFMDITFIEMLLTFLFLSYASSFLGNNRFIYFFLGLMVSLIAFALYASTFISILFFLH